LSERFKNLISKSWKAVALIHKYIH
jgi:hypothetical protein